MTPERWQKIEHLLQAALEHEPAEREALLYRECAGDHGLREEVESLLASAPQAKSFLQANALEDAGALFDDTNSDDLTIGQHFGPYSIEKLLGSGGMAVVYLAEDTRLGRKVALKLLDLILAGDSQWTSRFFREGRLASGLDHPNICTVHEVGEVHGRQFIAMQYIEGRTLRQMISEQRLSLDSVLSISLQVADALAFAHQQGIVHRDIKSANIIVTPRGQAKVLDFGLAKSLQYVDKEDQTHLTMTGAVMGTPASMSPEQARGESADHRSDIFSFGVVMYEMATGRTPFNGRSKADVISALLKERPISAAELNKQVPPRLSALLDRALAKEPRERYQSMSEMMADLRLVVSEAGGLDQLFNSADTARGMLHLVPLRWLSLPTGFGHWIQTHVAIVVLFAISLLAGLTFALYRAWPKPPRATSSQMKIKRLTTVGTATGASVSPDGKYIVYATGEAVAPSGYARRWPAGRTSLWVKQISTDRAVELVAAADVQYRGTTFSLDGEFVYYVAIDPDSPLGALYRVPVLGGPPRKILTHIACPITFSPDGKQFAFIRNDVNEGADALIVANVEDSGERTLAVRKGNDWFEEDGPAWSPDGKTIACAVGTDTGGTYMTAMEVPAAGGEPKAITSGKWQQIGRLAWLGDGSGLIVIAAENLGDSSAGTDTQIWQITYPGGDTRKITNELNGYSHTSLGLTADSRSLVAAQEDTSARIWLMTLDRSSATDTRAAKQITEGKFDGGSGLSWTPDGRIVYVTKVGDNEDVWVMNGDGTGRQQLTDDPAFDDTPIASPDGRYIYFDSTRTGLQQIWRMEMDGSNAIPLTEGNAISYQPSCSPDGKWLVFTSLRSGSQALWKMSVDGGEPVRLTDNPATAAVFSPDGKFISCVYFDEQPSSARWRLAIIPSEGGRPVKIFDVPNQTINALAGIWWTPDSRSLIYVDTSHGVSNVWSQPLDGGSPKQLTHFDTGQIFNLALTNDGRRLALARGSVSGDVVLLSDFR